jgi:hypothetical protein
MNKVVKQEHVLERKSQLVSMAYNRSKTHWPYQKGVKPEVRDPMVKGTTAVPQEIFEWDGICVFLDQYFVCAPIDQWSGKNNSRFDPPGLPSQPITSKILLKPRKVLRLVSEVNLLLHHVTKYPHFVRQGEPFEAREHVNGAREDGENCEITGYLLSDVGVKYFDCDGGFGGLSQRRS